MELKGAKIGAKCIKSFYYFFKTFWPEFSGETLVDNWHIKFICDKLQYYGEMIANEEELRKTVIVNVPPGSSKSSICTVAFPLWMWLIKPSCTTVNVAYSADLSKDHQELSKRIPESKRWRLMFDKILKVKYGKELVIDICNKNKLENNFGGKRFNTSVGGSITGKHCDILIEDDPLNPEQAFSEAERNTANRFHDKTISTRKKNDNCYLNIIIAQRLHEEDVCGHVLLKNIDIDHICLPGEITSSTFVCPEEAREYYVDGILNPIRKGRRVLDDLRESMGNDAYTTQVLQLPYDAENQDITPGMFNYIDEKELPLAVPWDLFIDGAFTEKTENDPTGIDVVAKIGKELVVKNSYDVKMKLPDLLKFIKNLATEGIFDPHVGRIFIEPKASGYPLAQLIEAETDFNFVLLGENNKGESKIVNAGKKARHELIKPKAESGRIKLVKDKWNDGFVNQLVGFPRAAHDEHVDNIGYAVYHYYHKENSFIADWALRSLEENIAGSFDAFVTSQMVPARNGRKSMEVTFEESFKGNVQLFDNPYRHYKHRYITVMVLRSEMERNAKSSILVYDRMEKMVSALYQDDDMNPRRITKKALEIAHLFGKTKLVVAVKKNGSMTNSEESDLSHMALQELREFEYDNIHLRLKINDITKKREPQYGFEVNPSTSRELYINLKDKLESHNIKVIPNEVYTDITNIERKPETGQIQPREGTEANTGLAYAIAVKVDGEWHDKPIIRNSYAERWH